MTALLAKSAFSARCTLYSPLQARTESDLQLWDLLEYLLLAAKAQVSVGYLHSQQTLGSTRWL